MYEKKCMNLKILKKKGFTMKTIIVTAVLMFLTVFASAGSQGQEHKHGKFTKHLEDSELKVTDQGLFSVELSIPAKRLLVGVNTFDLIIHDQDDRDVTGADITVTPWMPEMGHGVFDEPVVVEKGNGLYTIENIILVMGGHWEFRINVKKGRKEDKVIFDFPYIRTTEEYSYIKGETPAGFNAVLGMKNPLEELKPEIITENGQTVKVFNLTVKDMGFEIFPDKPMMGWGFNGQIPGPTIRVKQGDRIRVIVKNETTDGEHTLHIHGQKKPVVADGVPYVGQKPIKKGESYTYEFTVNNLGTSWYHCHVDSAHHVDMGMYGAFIVEPKEEKLKYDREYIMILDEWPTKHVHVHEGDTEMESHDEHGVVTIHEGVPPVHEHPAETPKKRDWYPKTHRPHDDVYDGFTINGKSFPFTEPVVVKEGERVRIRFINTGYKAHFMHTHSHKFIVVARDGSYVNEPQERDTIEVGSGQRVDIILLADNPGIWPFHCHRLDHITNDHIYPGGMMTFIQYIE
jgi:FtsP/CotA-like multicopper oxidase with cupredoxin domain